MDVNLTFMFQEVFNMRKQDYQMCPNLTYIGVMVHLAMYSYFAPSPRTGAKCCDQRFCLFVYPIAYLETRPSYSRHVLYTLNVAVARSSSNNNAICYVLPVLWMNISTYQSLLYATPTKLQISIKLQYLYYNSTST